MEEETFYEDVAAWLKSKGHAEAEIEKIINSVRRYDQQSTVDSLMESYANGGMTLAAIIEEATREPDGE